MLRQPRGQALAEFALIAPLLFLLLFGVVQIGLIMAAQNGLVNGARDAARKAATYRVNEASIDDNATFGSICDNVETQLTSELRAQVPGFDVLAMSRTISYEWQQDPNGTDYFVIVHVAVSYANPLYVPLVSFFLDASDGTTDNALTLNASEQMRIENPVLGQPATYPTGRSC